MVQIKIPPILASLGLNEKEIAIYLALLRIGTAPASILGKRTGITRSTAQYTCQQLQKKGLFHVIQKGNTFEYTAEQPEKLLLLIESQRQKLEEKESSVRRIMADLKKMMNPYAKIPKVQFFEGVDGLITMFNDVLEENKPLFGAFRLESETHPEVMEYVGKKYLPTRKKLQNPAYMLVNSSPETDAYRKNDASVNRVTLAMPEDQYPFDTCMHIYGDKVAFYSYKASDLTGVLIQNDHIHNTQFATFKMAWQFALMQPLNEQYRESPLPW